MVGALGFAAYLRPHFRCVPHGRPGARRAYASCIIIRSWSFRTVGSRPALAFSPILPQVRTGLGILWPFKMAPLPIRLQVLRETLFTIER
jgi:hypothetical protein